jgi:hypothetical protein
MTRGRALAPARFAGHVAVSTLIHCIARAHAVDGTVASTAHPIILWREPVGWPRIHSPYSGKAKTNTLLPWRGRSSGVSWSRVDMIAGWDRAVARNGRCASMRNRNLSDETPRR